MVGPAADHPDQDVRKPETKVKAGKERKRNDYVKDKTLHASRLNKMHPSVYFKLQFPPSVREESERVKVYLCVIIRFQS